MRQVIDDARQDGRASRHRVSWHGTASAGCEHSNIRILWSTHASQGSGGANEPLIAGELQTFKAQFFRALAHPTRIRMLEISCAGAHSAGTADRSDARPAARLAQLAVLRNQGIVSARKEGLSVRYALRDPLVGELLDLARRIFNNQLGNSRGYFVSCGGKAVADKSV